MKKPAQLFLVGTIALMAFSSCSRQYGIAQPTNEFGDQATSTATPKEPSAPVNDATTSLTPAQDVMVIADPKPGSSNADETVEYFASTSSILSSEDVMSKETPLNMRSSSEAATASTTMAADDTERKMDGFAIAGFVVSLVGLFIFGYIFGAISIVFSAIGLARTSKRPDELKGRGLSIAGLIIGIVDIVLLAILMSIM